MSSGGVSDTPGESMIEFSGGPENSAVSAEWEALKRQRDEWRREDAEFDRRDARLRWVNMACLLAVMFLLGLWFGVSL